MLFDYLYPNKSCFKWLIFDYIVKKSSVTQWALVVLYIVFSEDKYNLQCYCKVIPTSQSSVVTDLVVQWDLYYEVVDVCAVTEGVEDISKWGSIQ